MILTKVLINLDMVSSVSYFSSPDSDGEGVTYERPDGKASAHGK